MLNPNDFGQSTTNKCSPYSPFTFSLYCSKARFTDKRKAIKFQVKIENTVEKYIRTDRDDSLIDTLRIQRLDDTKSIRMPTSICVAGNDKKCTRINLKAYHGVFPGTFPRGVLRGSRNWFEYGNDT